jgi:tetratricopeptide (TPR) repeat protein
LLLEQAVHLARDERPEIAFDLLESFFENVSQNSNLKMLLGSLAAASQDNERALELLKQAAEISPAQHPLPFLARLQLSANMPEEALEALKKYKRDRSLPYDVRSTYALALSLLGKSQEALLEFDTVLRQNPRYSEAYLHRGRVWKKLGHPSEAEEDWKKAIESDWGNLAAYYELASLFEEQSHPADAIPYLRQLLRFEPQNYQIMLQLAELHQKSGNQTEARRLCEQVILKTEDPALKEKAKHMFAGN